LAERARLSREIHDGLLQNMVGVAMKIDIVARDPKGPNAELLSIRRDIQDSIVQARQSIWNMRSDIEPADSQDFIVALEGAGARATSGTPVRFRLNVSGAPRRCGEAVETQLLRIAQEALSNAVRHAEPTSVSLDLSFEADAVTLRVTDDGSGFEHSARASTSHFGLVTMRERAEQLGGRLQVRTASGAGTEIETTIPVPSHS